nr:FeoB-associated Cys-rich membrane protein [Paenibacillus turpanensis]
MAGSVLTNGGVKVIVNVLIGALIFGYSGWSLVRFIRRSRKGGCAGCVQEQSCPASCSTVAAGRNRQAVND